MKSKYISPSVEVNELTTAGVIAASGDGWSLPTYEPGTFNW